MKAFRKRFRLYLLVVTILMGTFSVPAFAASSNQIADNAGILSEYQIDSIENEIQDLINIKIAVAINNTGSRTTDAYAYNVAKDMYEEVFQSVSTGVVIVYCNSLEGFKIGVYSKGDVDINERELKNLIESSYALYKTDSLWIENSIISCVKHLKELEAKNTELLETQSNDVTNKEGQSTPKNLVSQILEFIGAYHVISLIISIIFFGGFAVGVVFLWKYYLKKRQEDENDYK